MARLSATTDRRRCWPWPVLGGLALLAGCSASNLPQIVPVTGTVTWQGAPVAGAQVMFMPRGSRPANGTTNEQGQFKLATMGQADGAVVGAHTVTITKRVPTSNEPYAPERSEIPPAYGSLPTSPLTAEVTAAGPNAFSFELVGEAK